MKTEEFFSEIKALLNVIVKFAMECTRIHSAKLGDKSLLWWNYKAENIEKFWNSAQCFENWMISNHTFPHLYAMQSEIQFRRVKSIIKLRHWVFERWSLNCYSARSFCFGRNENLSEVLYIKNGKFWFLFELFLKL